MNNKDIKKMMVCELIDSFLDELISQTHNKSKLKYIKRAEEPTKGSQKQDKSNDQHN
jgi:hypothetical protein